MIKEFNVRVYGILLNEENQVLVTDEFRLGIRMTKFPGGGLNFGEGIVECLFRECMEELNQEVRILEHFYTTEHYQPTKLLPETQQLISIYYRIALMGPEKFKTTNRKFDFVEEVDGAQTFRWVPVEELNPEEFTFPIDQLVAQMIKSRFSGGC